LIGDFPIIFQQKLEFQWKIGKILENDWKFAGRLIFQWKWRLPYFTQYIYPTLHNTFIAR
jgi:hypothetical protein